MAWRAQMPDIMMEVTASVASAPRALAPARPKGLVTDLCESISPAGTHTHPHTHTHT
eukprot:COSAG01_NODE_11327_length_1957_cov_3.009150_1_plen_56_part_10